MKNNFLPIFLLILSFSSIAFAQEMNTSIRMHGMKLSCFGENGQPVPVAFDEKAMELGGGGYAWFDPNRGKAIIFSEKFVNSISKLNALFLFYHECAHAALPIGVGLATKEQEMNADCYAVAQMRKYGLMPTWKEFSEAMSVWANSPGSLQGHLPGSQRLAAAAKCAKVPAIYNTNAICRRLDEIFSSGQDRLKKFEGEKTFSGLYCESMDNDSRLICSRDIDDKQARVSTAQTIISTVESCLPAEFKSRKSTSMPEFMVNLENVESGQSVTVWSDYIGRVVFQVVPK
ncbi:MAG: hypothetical protein WCK17_05735 [Verrucomicrobiota bacterium]